MENSAARPLCPQASGKLWRGLRTQDVSKLRQDIMSPTQAKQNSILLREGLRASLVQRHMAKY